MAMMLKSRIGELLQGRAAGSGGDVLDTEAMALQRQQEERSHKLHMRRLLAARNHELDDLRKIMVHRRKSQQEADTPSRRGVPATPMLTRPPGGVDGSQLVSLINDLEVKVLSEPMGLTGFPSLPRKVAPPVATHSESNVLPNSGSAKSHPLDDAALMVASRRWEHAGDLLVRVISSGDMTRGTDWATRSAIDLFDRGGQAERSMAMRQRYLQTRGREPRRIVPPRLSLSTDGQLHLYSPTFWKCPAQLGPDVPVALNDVLNGGKAGPPLVLDWTSADSIDVSAMVELRLSFERAMKSQIFFVHIGFSKLIRAVRQVMQDEKFSREAWTLWLALLNWAGLHKAHRTAAAAYAKRYQESLPTFSALKCICQPWSMPAGASAEEVVSAARLMGDLTCEQAEELDKLEARAARPGRLVLLDLRLLASMDFFFGADLLNWVIRRHSRGEMVSIGYAHPLLAHFLQMLGLPQYARLHGQPSAEIPQ